ncbi:hypothetical protein LJR225_004636 [Phenylobacterium sp. LjRoot225]|uniref:hypothetical protein n=1 Tax=Phenylobacterium sp. LjRoot225 TaxID=3342285 RepID=UPI003ECD5B9D
MGEAVLALCDRLGVKPSGSGHLVLAVLEGAGAPIDIHELVAGIGALGRRAPLTSIYRTLRSFKAAGLVSELTDRDRRRYMIAQPGLTTFGGDGLTERVEVACPELATRILFEARRLGLDVRGRRITITFSEKGV